MSNVIIIYDKSKNLNDILEESVFKQIVDYKIKSGVFPNYILMSIQELEDLKNALGSKLKIQGSDVVFHTTYGTCLAGLTKDIGEVKLIIMDNLRDQFPDKFRPDGSMMFEWFEKDIRPEYNCFIRKDVKSISFSFNVKNAPLSSQKAMEFINNWSWYYTVESK